MPWKADLSPIDHPVIIGDPYKVPCGRATRTVVLVKCPLCERIREVAKTDIKREMERKNFHGYCRKCAFIAVAEGKHRYRKITRKASGKRSNCHGYQLITVHDVPDELLPRYRSMQRSGQPVLEHRWVMAYHLNRGLMSNELVDHRNGKKSDNRIENLRIYIRGRNNAGSANGYGTYYHEWQMAEARIRQLEGTIAKIGARTQKRQIDILDQFLPLFKVET